MKLKRYQLKREFAYEVLVLPAFLLFVIFFAVPVIWTFAYSVTNWTQAFDEIEFVGLANFKRLFQDEEIVGGIKNSIFYALGFTVLRNILAFTLAIALDRQIRTKNFLRMIFFMPAVLSILVVSYLWKFMMAPSSYGGLINMTLINFNLPEVGWLSNPDIALISIIITQVWQWTGWSMVIYIANLQVIPNELYESAEMDGAKDWQLTTHIRIPLMYASFTINLVYSMLAGLKMFAASYAMTGGGPGYSTKTIIMVLIQRGFGEGFYGYASAFAIVFFIIIAIITFIQLGFLQRWERKVI